MDRITRNILCGSAAAALLFALGASGVARAATVGVTADVTSAALGAPLRVDVSLDTQGDAMNAIQGEIYFPSGVLQIVSVNSGNSPVSFWIEAPQETASGTVDFSGIVPGGFNGSAQIFSLLFTSIAPGDGALEVASATVLRNDGMGTPIAVTLGSAYISISSSPYSGAPANVSSSISPDPFVPVVSHDPNIFNGNYFIAFQATDKGTGIDHYEVAEVPAGASVKGAAWHAAASPYLLTDQTLASDIYVRAIDHAGNATVAKVPAAHPPFNWMIAFEIAIAFLILLLLIVWVVKRKK